MGEDMFMVMVKSTFVLLIVTGWAVVEEKKGVDTLVPLCIQL